MIYKNLLNSKNLILVNQIRCKIHPTPAKVEFIHGKSLVGKPSAFEPVRYEIEKGKSYSWCSCGASKRQPFCDGSHKKLNESIPEGQDRFAPLRFVCEESRTVHFCMCKSSSNRPFCDGTHQQLQTKDQKFQV